MHFIECTIAQVLDLPLAVYEQVRPESQRVESPREY